MKYRIEEVRSLNEQYNAALANRMVTERCIVILQENSNLTKKEARSLAWKQLKKTREAARAPKQVYNKADIMRLAWQLAKRWGKDIEGKYNIGAAMTEAWRRTKEETVRRRNMRLMQDVMNAKGTNIMIKKKNAIVFISNKKVS